MRTAADAAVNPAEPDREVQRPPSQVGHPAAEDQQSAEYQRVRREHPFSPSGAETQLAAESPASALVAMVASRTTTNWATQRIGIAQTRGPSAVLPPKGLILGTYPWLLKICNW